MSGHKFLVLSVNLNNAQPAPGVLPIRQPASFPPIDRFLDFTPRLSEAELMSKHFREFYCFLLLSFAALPAQAARDLYIEDFTASAANWANFNSSGTLTHFASGGPDGGGYASGPRSFSGLPNGPTDVTVILRARPGGIWNSSNNEFSRNWAAEGISDVSAYVRHDAPVPLTYFLRVAAGVGSPGHVYTAGISVPSGQWTPISFNVLPTSPQLVSPENGTWETVFGGDVARHVQFGVFVPTGFSADATAFNFAIDKVTISTPEPASAALSVMALMGSTCLAGKRSRRKRG